MLEDSYYVLPRRLENLTDTSRLIQHLQRLRQAKARTGVVHAYVPFYQPGVGCGYILSKATKTDEPQYLIKDFIVRLRELGYPGKLDSTE